MGASLAVHHHQPHDSEQYGASDSLAELVAALRTSLRDDASLVDVAGDLGDAATAEELVPS